MAHNVRGKRLSTHKANKEAGMGEVEGNMAQMKDSMQDKKRKEMWKKDLKSKMSPDMVSMVMSK